MLHIFSHFMFQGRYSEESILHKVKIIIFEELSIARRTINIGMGVGLYETEMIAKTMDI